MSLASVVKMLRLAHAVFLWSRNNFLLHNGSYSHKDNLRRCELKRSLHTTKITSKENIEPELNIEIAEPILRKQRRTRNWASIPKLASAVFQFSGISKLAKRYSETGPVFRNCVLEDSETALRIRKLMGHAFENLCYYSETGFDIQKLVSIVVTWTVILGYRVDYESWFRVRARV